MYILQKVIQLGREARQHCLEVPRREYTSKFWSGVRALQSKLLLVEIKALYKTGQLVTFINSLVYY